FSMRRYRALILFDIDGTLVRRAGPHHREALVQGIRRVTGLTTTTEGIPVQGMLDPEIVRVMMRRAGAGATAIRTAMPGVSRAAGAAPRARRGLDRARYTCLAYRRRATGYSGRARQRNSFDLGHDRHHAGDRSASFTAGHPPAQPAPTAAVDGGIAT